MLNCHCCEYHWEKHQFYLKSWTVPALIQIPELDDLYVSCIFSIKGYMTPLCFWYRWVVDPVRNNPSDPIFFKFSGHISGTSSYSSIPKTQRCHIPFKDTLLTPLSLKLSWQRWLFGYWPIQGKHGYKARAYKVEAKLKLWLDHKAEAEALTFCNHEAEAKTKAGVWQLLQRPFFHLINLISTDFTQTVLAKMVWK